jgi:hypothetical protein
MIVGAQQVNIKVKSFNELIAEVRVETDGNLISYFGNYNERPVKKSQNIFVFFLVTVFLHFETHGMVKGNYLVCQVVEEDKRTFERFHFHGVFGVHLGLKPSDKLLHSDVQHNY